MKKRTLSICLAVVVGSVFLLMSCAAPEPAPTPAPAVHPEFTVDLRTADIGAINYIAAAALEEAASKHPWLKIAHSVGGGNVWSVPYMAETKEAWGNTILVGSRSNFKSASLGEGPWENTGVVEGTEDFRLIFGYSFSNIMFVTFAPDIKTVYDLEGKRLGLGTAGQTAWAQDPLAILRALDIDVTPEFLGAKGAAEAMIEGRVSAAIQYLPSSGDFQKWGWPASYITLEATQKPLYFVDWTEEGARTGAALLYKDVQEYPPGTFPYQTETYWGEGGLTGTYFVHKTFPDEVAYEVAKLVIENYESWAPRHPALALLTPGLVGLQSYPKKYVHPGAARAYEELAGITYPD